MPEISRFLSIIVTMYYSEHPPPHFHVRYGNHKGVVAIDPPTLLRGALPPRVLGLVIEWAATHRGITGKLGIGQSPGAIATDRATGVNDAQGYR